LPGGRLNFVASKGGRDGSIAVNQDSDLYLAKLSSGESVTHSLRADRHAWVHVAEGEVTFNGERLGAGDGAAVSAKERLQLTAKAPSPVLLFDLN
jgi:quercetin 2,3-dioxygenase